MTERRRVPSAPSSSSLAATPRQAGPQRGERTGVARIVATIGALAFVLCPWVGAQSLTTGSKTASQQLLTGSRLVAGGSVEILYGGGNLMVTSAERTAHGVKLVLEPVVASVSTAAHFSKAATVELSQEAWERLRPALQASGTVATAAAVNTSAIVGHTVEAVSLYAGQAASTALVAEAIALVLGDTVIGLVLQEDLTYLVSQSLRR